MLDYAAAKELAQHVADAESKHLDSHESFVIVDEFAHEEPWGWVFEPAVEPYRSTSEPCLYGGAWCVSVDRFSGKIPMRSWSCWQADQWPIIDLHLMDAGSDSSVVYQFLRNYKGWTARETQDALGCVRRIALCDCDRLRYIDHSCIQCVDRSWGDR